MRKKEMLDKNWIGKTFRLKPEVIFLYKFLEFYMVYKYDISKDDLFNELVKDTLTYIVDNDIKIIRKNERTKRIVKGFSIEENVMDALNELFKEYKNLYKAEVVEFLIILYFKNKVNKKEAKPFITFLDTIISE
ncbi:MAG: hypothetical protein LKF87_12415 [Clostridium tyrobutyricum]|jgi:hypothetical protein|uniref:hypothetical protein n=1 Tax=Clostridium tyrobutyricum TaxID=1519 RepID=UPI00243223B4|nr:hypothetical protein [Clostridium tyrobutyricum]MCH4200162.1 hypothetical protein [Clostridium tyrobutyricum]MCH4237904.1 hypothetical protein [Clostridium tyrobutyricum]MCH4259730.1 hypothetical protein [Clostridium tyrobutyricum]